MTVESFSAPASELTRKAVLNGSMMTKDGLAKLKGLTSLKTLDLHQTAITDDGLQHLAALPLKTVGVSGTKVTVAGLERLKSGRK